MLPILPRTDGNAGQLNGLLDHMTAPPPKYVAVRPDGRPWERTFFSETAAWRAVLKDAASQAEWRRRKADLERIGWTVRRSD